MTTFNYGLWRGSPSVDGTDNGRIPFNTITFSYYCREFNRGEFDAGRVLSFADAEALNRFPPSVYTAFAADGCHLADLKANNHSGKRPSESLQVHCTTGSVQVGQQQYPPKLVMRCCDAGPPPLPD